MGELQALNIWATPMSFLGDERNDHAAQSSDVPGDRHLYQGSTYCSAREGHNTIVSCQLSVEDGSAIESTLTRSRLSCIY